MDFHTLARRDLQALCKKNKIPANLTNVAMADALQALELVEGIEELMQQSQSGTVQSSIDSLEMADVTSPFVPTTAGGRSTRRVNIPKPAPQSVNPMTRTRRTARKTQIKDADEIETPAMVSKTNRKKGVMVSAPLNINSQLKECADEDKRDFLMTPAVVTTRRKKAAESTVIRSYSTRRSVRLAEKCSVEISNEVAKDGENKEMNLNDGVDNFNELSGFTDGDAITAVEEKSENKDEFEAASDQKDTSFVQSTEELKFEEGETTEEDEADATEFVEKVILDSGDNFVVDEFYFDKIGSHDLIESPQGAGRPSMACGAGELSIGIVDGGSKEVTDLNATLDKLTELTLQQSITKEADSDFVNENEPNASKKAADLVPLEIEPIKMDTLQTEEGEKSDEIEPINVDTVPSSFEGVENEPSEIENLKPGEGEKAAVRICSSDNKENIGSGVKLVVMRDVKMAKKSDSLDDLSVRQLTKMLKEKLEITKKPSKTEIGNEIVMPRTALQAISENRMVDGAGN